MSIASNVIEENSRLGTVRTNLRNKLTRYDVYWYNSDTIATLARRIFFMQYPWWRISKSWRVSGSW